MERMRFCPLGEAGAIRRSSSIHGWPSSPRSTSSDGRSIPRSPVRQRIVGRERRCGMSLRCYGSLQVFGLQTLAVEQLHEVPLGFVSGSHPSGVGGELSVLTCSCHQRLHPDHCGRPLDSCECPWRQFPARLPLGRSEWRRWDVRPGEDWPIASTSAASILNSVPVPRLTPCRSPRVGPSPGQSFQGARRGHVAASRPILFVTTRSRRRYEPTASGPRSGA
jgi:hypothetical protein